MYLSFLFSFFSGLSETIPMTLINQIENQINLTEVNSTYFDKYLNTYPNSDYLTGMKSYYLISENKISDAEVLLIKNLKFASTFSFLAKAALEQSKGIENIEYEKKLKKSYKADKKQINKYIRMLLFDYYLDSDPAKAEVFLNEVLKMDSNWVDALVEKANLYKTKGDFEKAKEILDNAISINQSAYAYYYRSMFFFDNGDFKNAEEYLLKGLKQKQLPEIYCGLAQIANSKNDVNSSLMYLKQGLNIDSNNKFVLSNLGWHYTKEYDFASAKIYFEKMIEIPPKFYKGDFYGLLYTYLSLDEFDNAQKLIVKYNSLYEPNYQVDFFQILFFALTNNIEKAQDYLFKYNEMYSEDEQNWLQDQLLHWKITIKNK